MKSLSLLLGLACAILTSHALPPFTCERDDPNLPTPSYKMKESMDWNLAALRDHFTERNKVVSISDVLHSANHRIIEINQDEHLLVSNAVARPQSVYRWEGEDEGFDDDGTELWYPQGITSSSDALRVGTWEGRNIWIVSWYSNEYGSVRVTFIDKSTRMCRHVLLVVPNTPEPPTGPSAPATDFGPLDIHAGGIVWYGNTLWVADTDEGFRIFDLDNIWQVETGDCVGMMSNSEFSAQNYRYVIPQIRYGILPSNLLPLDSDFNQGHWQDIYFRTRTTSRQ
jgi:hypothetical protein